MRYKITLLLIFSFSFFIRKCGAQFNVYHPFPDSNAIWSEDSLDCTCGMGCGDVAYAFVVNGDTVVNSHTYHKVYLNGGHTTWCGLTGEAFYYSYKFFGAYREDSGRHVFACCTSYLGSHDSLLYDFNLKVGDTSKAFNTRNGYAGKPFVVQKIDSILIWGSYRKRWNFDTTAMTIPGTSVIEGIGSSQGLFDFMVIPFEDYATLDCFSQNNNTWQPFNNFYGCGIYTATDELQNPAQEVMVKPNPNNGTFTIQSSVVSGKWTVSVYDELGQEVYTKTGTEKINEQLKLENVAAGIYSLRLQTNNGIIVKKLVVMGKR